MANSEEVAEAVRPGSAGKERAEAIRSFISDFLAQHDDYVDVSRATAEHFGIRRHVVHKQLKRLEAKHLIEGQGRTKARVHRLAKTQSSKVFKVEGLDEDLVWREFVLPSLRDLAPNVLGVCQYGFTEMLNNVIDHSVSASVVVAIERTAKSVDLTVSDQGVGIFKKIQGAMNLPSLQEALFELTKGKFTTDPTRHTGEGIFFSSRAFDEFRLLSGGLFLTHSRAGDDWLSGTEDTDEKGTYVRMAISAASPHTMQEVFEHYSSERDDYGFNKTNVILRLLDTGDDSFVSRSQAKRVLARLPRFKEVVLDFEGVVAIGPAFADEIFRVFALGHPDVHLAAVRATDDVRKMISRAVAAREEAQGATE